MSEELKQCPFCGGEAEVVSKYKGLLWVECLNCFTAACFAHSIVEASAAWNRRAETREGEK